MLPISEGAEVLLKTGESVIVMSGLSTWRGQRWVGKGYLRGAEVQREFGDDDVRAVLGAGRSMPPSGGGESGSLF